MGTVYAMWLREMKRFLRSRSRIIGNLSMPFIWLALMGIGLSSSFTIPGVDLTYIEYLSPGIIGMALLFTSIFAGISVIWDKQFGFLKEILVAPVSRTCIIVGKIAGSATISMINGILILIIAASMGALPLTGLSVLGVASSLAFMLLVSVAFISIGLIIATRLNDTEGFQVIMSFLVMPIFFLSGAFFPIENVPVWMKGLAAIDPLKYGVDGLRGSLIGVSQLPVALNAAVLAGFGLAMILIAGFLFRRIR